jgi:hypothetical protein
MRALLLVLTTCLFVVLPAQANYSGGTGESNDPYRIATTEDLIALGETPDDYDKHFILTADIDLDPNLSGRKVFDKAVIAPTSSPYVEGTPFTGSFDGDGHTISHLTIAGGGFLGLFGQLLSGEVRDLGVVDVSIVGSGDYVGALVGSSGYPDNRGGTIMNGCYSAGVVSGRENVGGLVGYNGGTVSQCYSAATVSGTEGIYGGLVGENGDVVTHCRSTGAVTGIGQKSFCGGGLVGLNWGAVTESCSGGSVSGTGEDIGGLIGYNWMGEVTDCYSTGLVIGDSSVGGLVGTNDLDIGIMGGVIPGIILRCYSSGVVTGNASVGGLVGRNVCVPPAPLFFAGGCSEVTSSFWDMQASGRTGSDGGVGLTTVEMQTTSTFFDWGVCEGAGVWTIDEGHDYPRLSWEHRTGPAIQSHLSDFLQGTGTPDDPYLIYTLADVNTVAIFPCEQDKSFRLMFLAGEGTEGNPYQIDSADQLELMGMCPYGRHAYFRLMADIDLDPKLPGRRVYGKALIAPDTDGAMSWAEFTGVFDGGGRSILHLTIVGQSSLGVFGRLADGAQVRDLGVVDAQVTGSGVYIGGLAGANRGNVTNCYSTGSVEGSYAVGGLVGQNSSSSWASPTVAMTRCHSAAAVSGTSDIGGLVGENGRDIMECYSTGTVSGAQYVGGLVGDNGGTITQSYSAGTVSGKSSTGGLVGAGSGTVSACFWDIQTTGQIASAGGIGITTAQMQDLQMYLDAGWDFTGERRNGTHEVWQIPQAGGYPVLAAHRPLQGSGTMDDPYLISDAWDLGAMIYYRASAHYRLVAPVDLSGIHWPKAVIPRLTGILDGNGFTISHLTITGTDYLGLFGRLEPGAEVKDIGIVHVEIAGAGGNVGGLAGASSYQSTITHCYTTGELTGRRGVGGLVGSNDGEVIGCYSRGAVSGTTEGIGGLAGYNFYGGHLIHCYSTAAVTSTGKDVGGLVGRSWDPVGGVIRCFWDTQTSGQATSAGGTGKTTAEMQRADTFLEAGWDFVGETANGTEDIWWILEGKDYPRLWWELTPAK